MVSPVTEGPGFQPASVMPPYDPTGALGGLFAPAYIAGNAQSEAAVNAWNAANLKTAPAPDNPISLGGGGGAPAGGGGVYPGPASNSPTDWAAAVARYNAMGGANGSYRVPSPLQGGGGAAPVMAPSVVNTPVAAPSAIAAPTPDIRDRIAAVMAARPGG